MKTEWSTRYPQLSSSRTLSSLGRAPKRNLGCAILVAAIEDYQSLEDQVHASAATFLFATQPEYRAHYDWVVSMADGVNRVWLREALDGERTRWDRERLERKLRARLGSKARGRRENGQTQIPRLAALTRNDNIFCEVDGASR